MPNKRALARMSDEEIIERISQVRGIGRWTVEMMLLFRLGRPNVLPVDDYGVRKGMQRLYKLRELPNKDAMRRRARKWEPWCSVASWYMWRCAELPGPKPRDQSQSSRSQKESRTEEVRQRKLKEKRPKLGGLANRVIRSLSYFNCTSNVARQCTSGLNSTVSSLSSLLM